MATEPTREPTQIGPTDPAADARGQGHHQQLIEQNRELSQQASDADGWRPIRSLGIVGAGLMGQSIAARAISHGISVRILDANRIAAETAVQQMSMDSGASKSEAEVVVATDYDQFANLDLVIESVVETKSVKHSVLAKIESAVDETTFIATNTSAIPVADLATVLKFPKRFGGIHFCHPELMSLVEIISGSETSAAMTASSIGFVNDLGMLPVAIRDTAGFVVNRLLAAMMDQGLRMVAGGVPFPDIDAAMRRFGFAGGPFEIIDVIGCDTCMYAGRTMWEHALACVSLSPMLPRMVKQKRLGRKTLAGFYRYETPAGPALIDPATPEILQPYIISATAAGSDVTSDLSIADQILAAMTLEAFRIIEERIVARPGDVDLCVIEGLSFPTRHGGLLYRADEIGWATICKQLQAMGKGHAKLIPDERLVTFASENGGIYQA